MLDRDWEIKVNLPLVVFLMLPGLTLMLMLYLQHYRLHDLAILFLRIGRALGNKGGELYPSYSLYEPSSINIYNHWLHFGLWFGICLGRISKKWSLIQGQVFIVTFIAYSPQFFRNKLLYQYVFPTYQILMYVHFF